MSEEKNQNHYIDNSLFFEEMSAWKLLVIEAENSGDPAPVNNYIGECFLKIAERLSHKPNFINYAYREEMVGDGIENCLMYAHNFNPEKSKNPFSYFTQIIYYAFLRRIEKEKKQSYIKYKALEMNVHDPSLKKYFNTNYFEDISEGKSERQIMQEKFNLSETDVENLHLNRKRKEKRKEDIKEKTSSLDNVMSDVDTEKDTDENSTPK